MSDLVDRQDAIDTIAKVDMQIYDGDSAVGKRFYLTQEEMIAILESLPSTEPKTAKVEKQEKVYESSNHMFAYETWGECGNCGEPVKQGANYCSWCGMKLDWSRNE